MNLSRMSNSEVSRRTNCQTRTPLRRNAEFACEDTDASFTEIQAWRSVGSGWQRVFGGISEAGYSIEWHDFSAGKEIDWAASFHPRSVELCLNLEGWGYVAGGNHRADFPPASAGFYRRGLEPLTARRSAGQRHRFLTLEFSSLFLAKHLHGIESALHPMIRSAVEGTGGQFGPATTTRLNASQQQIVAALRQPPVYAAAQPLWYQCKALELAVAFFLQPPPDKELFCARQQRLARERTEQVIFLLERNLAEPPSLEELGKKIGCSPFYLSRIFSNHTGQTITQYLRQLRLEKAAELLRDGELNVTEVALEVGYSSPSHFSHAFREMFGCCPGLYPIAANVKGRNKAQTRLGYGANCTDKR
jgi:AraC-like DNA-binding protein